MVAFFDRLARDDLPYRPLLTNQYVLDELAALLVTTASHERATRALDSILESNATTVLSVSDDVFDDAVTAFRRYVDHEISLTDHAIARQAAKRDVEDVLTYDTDFEALGFTVVPRS